MRGATRKIADFVAITIYFNPRAPCGARPRGAVWMAALLLFQSTRPMRGATDEFPGTYSACEFQSTRPMRGATPHHRGQRPREAISIHAPHAGRDETRLFPRRGHLYFNPRAPCGARRRRSGCTSQLTQNFNPRAPCGARPQRIQNVKESIGFQSTRPMRGATRPRRCSLRLSQYFNPRAPCGARQQKYTKLLYTLLRQKAIFRQFHAKRRLLKRFSTYKYRNTFLICSANRMGKICTLPLRTTRSLDLPEGMSACNQSARFCFRTFFPSSKTADYPAPDP